MSEELQLRVLRTLQDRPDASQKQLAQELGVSVGRTHYAVSSLVQRGWLKTRRFQRTDNKWAYAYHLTPKGLAEKARLAYRFLQRKRDEHDALLQEIEALRAEVEKNESGGHVEPGAEPRD